MTTWKLLPNQPYQQAQVAWRKLEDGTEESCLVTAEHFKKEVLAGAELQDADGNVMTQEQANQFIASLP